MGRVKNSDVTKTWRVFKSIAALLLGRYRINRICGLTWASRPLPLPRDVIMREIDDLASMDGVSPLFRERSWYRGNDAHGFGLFQNEELVCLCWFWGSRRFNDSLLWTLRENEAFLMDLLTAPEFRGRNFAPLLISLASKEMQRLGHSALYSSVWYTNRASLRAFEKAGWRQICVVAEINPLSITRPIRFIW